MVKKSICYLSINLLFAVLLSPITCLASDDFELIKVKEVNQTSIVSVDKRGNYYLVNKKNEILQYDKNGELLTLFSPQNRNSLSSIEAWNGLSVLCFYREQQEIILLDRFLVEKSSVAVNHEITNNVRAATLSNDNNILLVDDESLALKKTDQNFKNTLFELSLKQIFFDEELNISHIREYQNNIYVSLAGKGILVFDNMGNYKKMLYTLGVDYFNFIGQKLYFVYDNTLHMYDMYSLEHLVYTLPQRDEKAIKFAFVSNDRLLVVTDDKAYWYKTDAFEKYSK